MNSDNVRSIVIMLLLIVVALCSGGGLSKAKAFGIAGLTFSLLAVGSDVGAEYYYDKYEKATLPEDCVRYRDRTEICETARDMSFGLAVASFSVSTVLLLRGKRQSVSLDMHLKEGKLCAGLVRLLP